MRQAGSSLPVRHSEVLSIAFWDWMLLDNGKQVGRALRKFYMSLRVGVRVAYIWWALDIFPSLGLDEGIEMFFFFNLTLLIMVQVFQRLVLGVKEVGINQMRGRKWDTGSVFNIFQIIIVMRLVFRSRLLRSREAELISGWDSLSLP